MTDNNGPDSSKWDIPEGEFCIFGTVYAHPEKADALEAVYAETTRLAQHEAGIVSYCLARDRKDPAVFHFFERYRDRKAFDEHNSQPIIQKLLNEDRYIRDVTAQFMKPIGLEGGR
ncbi:putative antibiotic biosynthesis monooxygenase [Rosellinia necatrix]|uniref:Putative antibiotic biosynthesis monooxygenase n=1 Tax=Rosellinia necatrix TaxID=77044 RepID=A0A1W2TNQ2_ROSNE|nr:putative antibiotic biosynthesis monooxygenase [Rosellinia necatrix]